MAKTTQPANTPPPAHAFAGGGTSQAERLAAALLPEHLRLDERTLPELLAYITRFSEQVRFYEGGTGQPKSHAGWQLAQHQPLLRLATVATYPSASLAARTATELRPLADAAAPASAQRHARRQLLHRLTEQATTLARWKTEQGPGQEQRGFSSALDEALKQFVPALRQAVGAERQLRAAGAVAGPAQLHGALATLAAAAGSGFGSTPWSKLPEETLADDSRGERPSEASPTGPHITKATDELRELLERFDHALSQLARVATISLHHDLQPPPGLAGGSLPPEAALLVAFLRLYQHAQQELNAIPERHLDFYYNQVLGTTPRPGQPDQVFLSFTLAKGIASYTLPKGSRIGGAKTPAGQPIIFATRHEAVLAAWQVAALATLFVARTPTARVTGIYAVPPQDPAGAGGPGAPGPGRLWPLFGEDQKQLTGGRTLPDARVGFAIADPVLVLQGGERLLTLRATVTPGSFADFSKALQQAADEENEDAEPAWRVAFAVQGTGAAGWQPLAVQGVALDAGTHTVEWTLHLAASQPGLVGYDPVKHGPGFTTTSPVLQFTLAPQAGVYAYSAGAALRLTALRLDVLVTGLRQLEAANQLGALKTSAPFYPFGARTLADDYLLLGAPELAHKKLLRAHLQLTWQHLPSDFAEYYASYGQPLTNDSFRVSATHWADGAWEPAGTQALFRTGFSGKLLPVTTLDFGRLGYCGESPTGHQLRVQLAAPAWGFGDYLYPQVLASTSLYNASVVSRPPAAPTTAPASQPKAAAVAPAAAPRTAPARLLPLPRPPFILLAQEAQLSYQAEAVLHPGQLLGAGSHFYHLQPFTITEPLAHEPLPLLPALPDEGTLLVGLSASAAGQVVELLFDLLAPTNLTGGSKALPPVQWAYLEHEQWVAVAQPAYLAVPPPGFASACRVQVHLPAGLGTEHRQLPSGLCWLRATVAANAAAFGQVRALYGPLVLAERVAPALGPSTGLPLAAGQLTQPVPALPAIAQVQQPLPSFGGLPAEGPNTHRLRISERLRHRNRALTPWDYEHLLLARFPTVHSALCLPAGQAPPPWVPGQVVVVVLPQPNGLLAAPPLFGPAQLLEMTRLLQALAPAAVRLDVRNPCYERVQVRATVAYQAAPHQSALVPYGQQLQRDLNQFLSPWHQADPQQGGFHHHLTLPAVQAFLGSRPYVRAVSGLSVIKTAFIEGEYRFYDSVHDPAGGGGEIGPMLPWAVLVPAPHHLLAVGAAATSQPQPTGIGDLAVGESLSVACDF